MEGNVREFFFTRAKVELLHRLSINSFTPIILWVFIWGFYTRRYTIVQGFCLFKLFLMGRKELTIETQFLLSIESVLWSDKFDFPPGLELWSDSL